MEHSSSVKIFTIPAIEVGAEEELLRRAQKTTNSRR